MKSKPAPTPTTAAIAASLKLSQRRVNQLRKAGLPITDIESARKWYREKSGGNSVEALRRERIGLVRSQRERQEVENAVRRGELIPAGEVQESVAATMAAARLALVKALVNDAPARLEGLAANQIAREMKAIVMTILTQLSTAQYYDSDEVAAIVEQAKAAVVKSK